MVKIQKLCRFLYYLVLFLLALFHGNIPFDIFKKCHQKISLNLWYIFYEQFLIITGLRNSAFQSTLYIAQ